MYTRTRQDKTRQGKAKTRQGWGEVGESKMETEVEVKMACPLGRRREEIPTRKWDREESGRK